MAYNNGPTISTNGLVLLLDAANRKSYSGTGTTWTDLSGNGNHGTLVNGVGYNSTNGGSLVFDGVNDYINCGNPVSLQLTSQITIFSWIKGVNFSGAGNIVNKGANVGYRFRVGSAAQITWFDRGATNAISTSEGTISTGVWYNIVVTGDTSGLKIYVNGILNTSGGSAFSPTPTSLNFEVGAATEFGEYFNGSISNTSVYNRALTPQEILQNYNATRSRFNV